VINQTLISECRGTIDKIDLFVKTFTKENIYPLVLNLTELTSGQFIQSKTIPNTSLDNNGWKPIELASAALKVIK
jgi:hypothetical protein